MTEDVKKIDIFTNRIPSNSLDEIKNIVNDNVSAFERNFKTSNKNLPDKFSASFEYGLNLTDSGKHFCSVVLFLYLAERRFFDVSINDISTILGISESHVKKIGSEIGNWPNTILKFIERSQKDNKYFYSLSDSVIEIVEKLLPEKLLDSSFRIKNLFKNRNIADDDESTLKLLRIQNKKEELVHDHTVITNEILLKTLDLLRSNKNCLIIGVQCLIIGIYYQ